MSDSDTPGTTDPAHYEKALRDVMTELGGASWRFDVSREIMAIDSENLGGIETTGLADPIVDYLIAVAPHRIQLILTSLEYLRKQLALTEALLWETRARNENLETLTETKIISRKPLYF